MSKLLWTGNEDVEVFHDTKRNIEYWPSERPLDVPDDAVEWYLSFDGWKPPGPPDDSELSYGPDLDVDEFVGQSWQTISAAIRSGEVDDALDEIEDAERSRDGDPREKGVLAAIEDRRDELTEG